MSTLRLILDVLLGVLAFPVLALVGAARRSPARPWVIGGHRGRIVEDNSAALFYWMRTHTDQPLVWIGDAAVVERLRAEGHPVLRRNSLAARLALFSAPALLYSHGDDDLDVLMHAWRWAVGGFRVYLSHSLTMFKGGEQFDPAYQAAGPLGRWFRRRVMTDFDRIYAISPYEKSCFDRSYPDRTDRILPTGGGAHVDGWMRVRATPSSNTLYWFPTHRDDDVGREALARTLEAVTQHPDLTAWLQKEGYILQIGVHINTGGHALRVAPPFELRSLSTLKEDLAVSKAFISDYSGLIGNYFVFDRPLVSFPFDLVTYLRQRRLFVAVEDLATGPVCYSVDEFVDALTSGAWHDSPAQQTKRRAWYDRLYPHDAPVYAESTYRAICTDLGRAAEVRA